MRMRSKVECMALACALLVSMNAGCSDDDGGDGSGKKDSGTPPAETDSGAESSTDSGPEQAADAATSVDAGSAGITEEQCLATAADAGTPIGDTERQQCVDEVGAAQCDAVAPCFCDNCICLLGACQMNDNCMGILGCAQATGCQDMACFTANFTNPACTGLLTWATDAVAIATATGVGQCLSGASCLDIACESDGGT